MTPAPVIKLQLARRRPSSIEAPLQPSRLECALVFIGCLVIMAACFLYVWTEAA